MKASGLSTAWHAELKNALKFLPLLRSLRAGEKCNVILAPSVEGLKISACFNRVAQRHIYIPRALFAEWSENKDDGDDGDAHIAQDFSVPLENFIEALEVCSFDSSSPGKYLGMKIADAVELSWAENTGEVIVRCINSPEKNIMVSCSLATIEVWERSHDWGVIDPVCKLITDGKFLARLLLQFQAFSVLRFEACPSESVIRLSAEDLLGSLFINVPLQTGSVESFKCDVDVEFSFPTAPLQNLQKVFASASKASLRIDQNGRLSIQLLISFGSDASVFYEVLVMSLV